MTTEKAKRKGNYNHTKNPRIIEARNLRKRGATDEDLSNAGFTAIEISRSFVPYSSSNYQRCRTCGCKAIVDLDRVCMGCQMTARMEREAREAKMPKKVVPVASPPVDNGYIHFNHPAIIRRKN
jgi:hypothetical protein